MLLAPPVPIADLVSLLRGPEAEDLLRRLLFYSAEELLDEYFESDEVKAAFANESVIGHFSGPWRRGSGEMTDYALVREGGFDLIRLEIFIEEFFRAVEEQAPEEVLRFRAAEKRDQVSDRDRRGEEHWFHEVVDLGPHRLVLR